MNFPRLQAYIELSGALILENNLNIKNPVNFRRLETDKSLKKT